MTVAVMGRADNVCYNFYSGMYGFLTNLKNKPLTFCYNDNDLAIR